MRFLQALNLAMFERQRPGATLEKIPKQGKLKPGDIARQGIGAYLCHAREIVSSDLKLAMPRGYPVALGSGGATAECGPSACSSTSCAQLGAGHGAGARPW